MSKALNSIYNSVSNVHLEGMNSTNFAQVNFIASPQGVTQVFKAADPKDNGSPNQRRLPDIKLESYAVRDNSFLKASDDPRSSRFVSYEQFPKNSTKGNIKGKQMMADFRSSQ